MQLATVISLLLFACTACALQLHYEERRNGFRSSVSPRHSFQLPRRRLASRKVGSLTDPDIVPRGHPMYHVWQVQKTLNELKRVKEKDVKEQDVIKHIYNGHFRIYRIKLPHHFGEESLVVKEISSTISAWNEETLKKEVSGVEKVKQLRDVFFDGETYFILMKDMGRKWVMGESPIGLSAFEMMNKAEKRCEDIHGMKRVFNPSRGRSYDDYAWIRHDDGTWEANLVGSWRFGVSTWDVPRAHYSGIKEWDENGLPVFFRLDSTRTNQAS